MESRHVICRNCGAAVAMRVSRVGFIERKVLSRLGIYPWKCGACGSAFLFPSRGHGVQSRTSSTRIQDDSFSSKPRKPRHVRGTVKPRA